MTEDMDLDMEYRRAQAALEFKAYQVLVAAGVPAKTLVATANHRGPFRIGIARVHGAAGRWAPDAQGHRAYVLPANEIDGLVDDLVAFRPGTPGVFWRRRGTASIMGRAAIFRAIETGDPLHLCANPLEWLRGGRNGFVILDWDALLPIMFDDVSEFHVDDMAQMRRLQKNLERPRAIPPIRVLRTAVAKSQIEAHKRQGAAA